MNRSIEYRPEIDGLRAIAVLLVVWYHAFPGKVSGGFIGVDVFFVISGYLISKIILKEISAGTFSFSDFYLRRCRRILPGLILILLATGLLGLLVLNSVELMAVGNHLLGGSFFYSNFLLLGEAGYFDGPSEYKPLLHLWSLAVEEQFYLIWPVILLLASKKQFLWLLFVSSFALNYFASKHFPEATFYLLPFRFWELSAGALVAASELSNKSGVNKFIVLSVYKQRFLQFFRGYFGIVPVLAIIVAGLLINSQHWSSGVVTLLPVFCSVLILSIGDIDKGIKFLLANRLAVFFGLISYPLYLWHWPLLVFFKIVQDDLQLTINQVRVARIIIIFSSILLAYLTYKFVEIPASKYVNRFIRENGSKTKVLFAFCIALVFVGGFGFFVSIDGLPIRHVVAKDGEYRTLVYESSEDELKSRISKFAPCDGSFGLSKSELDWCYQSGDAPKVAIVGDSHARALYLGIADALPQKSSILVARGACPPAIFKSATGISTFDRCVSENKINFDYITANTDIDIVVMVTYGTTYSESHVFGNVIRAGVLANSVTLSDDVIKKRELLFEGLDEAIAKLIKAGKHVVMVIDVPELGFHPSECVHTRPYSNNLRTDCFVKKSLVIERQKNYRDIIERLKIKHKEMLIFDSLSVLCDSDKCFGAKDGHIFYHDDNHLGVFGSQLVGKALINNLPGSWWLP